MPMKPEPCWGANITMEMCKEIAPEYFNFGPFECCVGIIIIVIMALVVLTPWGEG